MLKCVAAYVCLQKSMNLQCNSVAQDDDCEDIASLVVFSPKQPSPFFRIALERIQSDERICFGMTDFGEASNAAADSSSPHVDLHVFCDADVGGFSCFPWSSFVCLLGGEYFPEWDIFCKPIA